MKVDILGVKIDQVNIAQAVEQIEAWLALQGETLQGGRYIVTPNPEMIILAQKDEKFRTILNNADLAIPDSPRIAWAYQTLYEKNPVKKLLKWLSFPFPKIYGDNFPTVAGVDLMESLIKLSNEKGFTIGLLGGKDNVAEKLKECLLKKYPKLKIVFTSSGGVIDEDGNQSDQESSGKNKKTIIHDSLFIIPKLDILFVAFGHGKQEKWIANNLNKLPVKVMMGVGGAFDYLSGNIARAPEIIRVLAFEWLFRAMLQPWRIKRFSSLWQYLVLVFRNRGRGIE